MNVRNGRPFASLVILAALALPVALAACEKKNDAALTDAGGAPVVAVPVATAPAAPAPTAALPGAPVGTLAPTSPVTVNGKATPVHAVRLPDGGAIFMTADGGIVDAATAQTLAAQAAALATAAGIQVPTTIPTVITIPTTLPTTITIPTAFPTFPGMPDAGKK